LPTPAAAQHAVNEQGCKPSSVWCIPYTVWVSKLCRHMRIAAGSELCWLHADTRACIANHRYQQNQHMLPVNIMQTSLAKQRKQRGSKEQSLLAQQSINFTHLAFPAAAGSAACPHPVMPSCCSTRQPAAAQHQACGARSCSASVQVKQVRKRKVRCGDTSRTAASSSVTLGTWRPILQRRCRDTSRTHGTQQVSHQCAYTSICIVSGSNKWRILAHSDAAK
jgi:hypothetical protein